MKQTQFPIVNDRLVFGSFRCVLLRNWTRSFDEYAKLRYIIQQNAYMKDARCWINRKQSGGFPELPDPLSEANLHMVVRRTQKRPGNTNIAGRTVRPWSSLVNHHPLHQSPLPKNRSPWKTVTPETRRKENRLPCPWNQKRVPGNPDELHPSGTRPNGRRSKGKGKKGEQAQTDFYEISSLPFSHGEMDIRRNFRRVKRAKNKRLL